MPHSMMIFYFRLPYFTSQIVLYFLHSISVLPFYIDVVLALSILPDHAGWELIDSHSAGRGMSTLTCGLDNAFLLMSQRSDTEHELYFYM